MIVIIESELILMNPVSPHLSLKTIRSNWFGSHASNKLNVCIVRPSQS